MQCELGVEQSVVLIINSLAWDFQYDSYVGDVGSYLLFTL
jgi:hypothetical protein